MSASSTVNRAVRILGLISPRDPVDTVLRRELAPRRDLSPGERRGIVRAVAAYFRWLGWLNPHDSSQSRVETALALQARFDSAPASIKPEALAARAVPEWLADEMDSLPLDWLRQLQRDPPLWIRVRQRFAGSLPPALGDCAATSASLEEGPGSASAAAPSTPDLRPSIFDSRLPAVVPRLATAFRYTGAKDLFLTEQFQRGEFEIQDLASQLVGHACAPAPGETWWDACAGEGGKTLHLADLMQNKGLVWASDRSVRRIDVLKKRAARAEVFNYRAVLWNGGPQPPTKTRFNGVLVDAPCSGVGTWQRHPHARWTVSPTDIRELAGVQQQLLDRVAGSVKPGGRLVYSVCTLTRAETTGVVAEFAARHPEFAPAAVFPETAGRKAEVRSQQAEGRETPPRDSGLCPLPSELCPPTSELCPPTSVFLWPHELNSNGMFIAAWRRVG
jgi:16S rRNA (cytosine967-C5)-methyltransferase